jgi:uncharacterized protein YbaP (TraB family)
MTPEGRFSNPWGTMHSIDRAVLDLPKKERVLIEEATIVAIELDPTPETRPAVVEMNRWDCVWEVRDMSSNACEAVNADLI